MKTQYALALVVLCAGIYSTYGITMDTAQLHFYAEDDPNIVIGWTLGGGTGNVTVSLLLPGQASAFDIVVDEVSPYMELETENFPLGTTTVTLKRSGEADSTPTDITVCSPAGSLVDITNSVPTYTTRGNALPTVTWTDNCFGDVTDVSVSLVGTSSPVIAELDTVPMTTGSLAGLFIPQLLEGAYRIQISHPTDPRYNARSDLFTVCAPGRLSVDSPSLDSAPVIGTSLNIVWSSFGCWTTLSSVTLELLDADSSSLISPIASDVSAFASDDSPYVWDMSSVQGLVVGTPYQVRITADATGADVVAPSALSRPFVLASPDGLTGLSSQGAFALGTGITAVLSIAFCVVVWFYMRPTRDQLMQRERARTASLAAMSAGKDGVEARPPAFSNAGMKKEDSEPVKDDIEGQKA